jgi:D-alanine-D-alanine ligase
MNGFRWKHHVVDPRDVEKQIRALIDEGVQVFVNLCDGTPDDPVSGIGLVKIMERLGLAFTGAGSAFFDPTRQQMKSAARRALVPIPDWMMVSRPEDAEKLIKRLRFPMLIKPPHGYSSVGLTRSSRVENAEALRERLAIALREFDAALVEEFIKGREFTCLIADNPSDPQHPVTFKPVEFIFPEGETFKHYDMKWVDYEKMSVAPVNEPRIEKTLRAQTTRVFQALEGNGYARCDYRMDSSGTLYMLEINPNCGIFYPLTEPGSADFSLLNDPINHEKFLKMIISSALNRQERVMAERLAKRRAKKRPIEIEEPAYA